MTCFVMECDTFVIYNGTILSLKNSTWVLNGHWLH